MLNKAMIIGNLGRDPEMRYTQSGTAVATLAVATTRSWTDKQTNQRKEETEWHRVAVFGRTAEACQQYLAKGSKVYVEGRIRTRNYEDKDGVKRYSTEIIADTVQFLGRKDGGQGGGHGGESRDQGGYGGSQDGQGQGYGGGYGGRSGDYSKGGPGEDDIPF